MGKLFRGAEDDFGSASEQVLEYYEPDFSR